MICDPISACPDSLEWIISIDDLKKKKKKTVLGIWDLEFYYDFNDWLHLK